MVIRDPIALEQRPWIEEALVAIVSIIFRGQIGLCVWMVVRMFQLTLTQKFASMVGHAGYRIGH